MATAQGIQQAMQKMGAPIDANTFAYSISRSLDPCFASGVSYYNLNIVGATDYSSKTCDAGTDGLDKTAATALIGKSIVVKAHVTVRPKESQPKIRASTNTQVA
jgi:hypothetical protein